MSVVNINGAVDITPGKPNPECVSALEEALEQARSGEIIGVTIIKRHYDRAASFYSSGVIGSYAMIGALQCAQAEMVGISLGDDDA